MKWLTAFISGLLFAIGLGISGMTQPEKVIAFLDITGNWDPSLMFVMGGAVGINLILYRLTVRRQKPVYSTQFTVPRRRLISHRLTIGSALFGCGWGIAGYCPGPALVATTSGASSAFIFTLSMLLGMMLFQRFQGSHKNDDVETNDMPTDNAPSAQLKQATADASQG